MKKVVSLIVVVLVCLVLATAMAAPSKTAGDLQSIEATAENLSGDGFVVRDVEKDEEEYEKLLETCDAEIEKLAAAASVEEYFGDLADVDGNAVDLKEMLDTEALNVFEFFPIIASGYEESFGEVTAKLVRPTPYEAGEKLAAVLGVVTYKEDGTQEVAWTVFEAVGVESDSVEEEGCIEVKLDPESVLTIQENDTLMAIVSK